MLHLVIFSIFVLSWVTQAGFYILIWWPCKQYWNSSFRFVYQYWLNIWALHFSLESAVSILLEVRLSSLVFSTYMEEEGASAIMRWGRHLGVKCAERERVCVTCISVLVCFWMHSVQKWTRIGSIKCTRSTGPSSALYKTPADMFGPELLLSSLQFQVFPEKPCVILFAS